MNARAAGKPRILHCHSGFSTEREWQSHARLIDALGPGLHHTIVTETPESVRSIRNLSPYISVSCIDNFPQIQGKPTPTRLLRLARALQDFDLILTYNWGAMNVAMAHTLFSDMLGLPPLIHHEEWSGEDEAEQLKWSRNWYRRIGLGKASGLVVPSERLEEIALTVWHQPLGRVKRITNGIDTAAFAAKPAPDALRGVVKREGESWLGTFAELRANKQLPALVRAFAPMPGHWHLVIIGDGPEKHTIRAEAERLEVSHRVHMPGSVADPARALGLFDIFACSSESEHFPISVVQAMAAGLPVAAPDVGDILHMVSVENRPFIVASRDQAALSNVLSELAASAELRRQAGAANRTLARAQYDERRMFDAYRRLYSSALGSKI